MNLKLNAGYAAAELVKDGQVLGLGTGSTTHYFIEKVGQRVKEEELELFGIPTSYQSFLLAKKWNIPCTTLNEYSIDLAVDGADEVDPHGSSNCQLTTLHIALATYSVQPPSQQALPNSRDESHKMINKIHFHLLAMLSHCHLIFAAS